MTADDVLSKLADLVAERLRAVPAGRPEWLSLAEVGRRLGRHPDTVARDVRAGRLPGRKVGGRWRVKAADLEAALAHEDAARRQDEARVADAEAWLREQRAQHRALRGRA